MTDTEVLNNILKDVDPLLRRPKKKKGKLFQYLFPYRFQKVSMYGGLGLLGAAMVCVGMFFFLPAPQIRWSGWVPIVEWLMRIAGLSIPTTPPTVGYRKGASSAPF